MRDITLTLDPHEQVMVAIGLQFYAAMLAADVKSVQRDVESESPQTFGENSPALHDLDEMKHRAEALLNRLPKDARFAAADEAEIRTDYYVVAVAVAAQDDNAAGPDEVIPQIERELLNASAEIEGGIHSVDAALVQR